MSPLLLDIALLWLLLLLAVSSVAIVRSRSQVQAIVVFDFLNFVVIAVLVVVSFARGVTWYLDTALVLALLSFTATIALAKASMGRRMFR